MKTWFYRTLIIFFVKTTKKIAKYFVIPRFFTNFVPINVTHKN